MSRSIWKYELEAVEEQTFDISGPVPLSVGVQGGRHGEKIVMWSVVDTMLRSQTVRVVIRGTGHDAYVHDGRHLGTVQMSDGLVFHVFTSVYG